MTFVSRPPNRAAVSLLGPTMFLLLLLAPAAEPVVVADAIFINGKVWTVDSAKPEAQAIAVWHGRILKVGTDAEVKQLAGTPTKVFDLGGRRVIPGIYDSHVHFLAGGQSLSRVDQDRQRRR